MSNKDFFANFYPVPIFVSGLILFTLLPDGTCVVFGLGATLVLLPIWLLFTFRKYKDARSRLHVWLSIAFIEFCFLVWLSGYMHSGNLLYVKNNSSVELRNLAFEGNNSSKSIEMLAPKSSETTIMQISGESRLEVAFVAENQRYTKGPSWYIMGSECILVTITEEFEVEVETRLFCFSFRDAI